MTKIASRREETLTLTISETARELGISEYLARRLVKNGSIPSVRLGRLVRVPRIRLMELVSGNKPSD
jgi:predicted site-specific integrase-resolvase